MTIKTKRMKFTADQFEQMAEAGICYENDRVELIDGEVVEMAATGHRHMQCVDWTTKLFVLRFSDDVADVSVQNSVRISDRYVPQPDLALFRLHPGLYRDHIPTVEDVLLLVEAGDITAQLDLHRKVPRYGRGGVPELWLVDLQQETITVCREPVADGSASMTVYRRGDRFAPLAFPDRPIAATDILGQAP